MDQTPTSVNSRLCVLGDHISGGGGVNVMFLFVCFRYFSGGLEILGGKSPQEIAGINTEFPQTRSPAKPLFK